MLDKFKHNCLRFHVLLSRLTREEHPHSEAGRQECPTLKHYLALCASRAAQSGDVPINGSSYMNGQHKHSRPAHRLPAFDGPTTFVQELDYEVERVRRFILSFTEELWLRLLDVADSLQGAVNKEGQHLEGAQPATALSSAGAMPSARDVSQQLPAASDACGSLGADLVAMDEFVRRNVAAAAELVELRDRGELDTGRQAGEFPEHSAAQHPVYLACMKECLLGEISLDPILVGLSDVYEQVRVLATNAAVAEGVWEPPSKFQRETTKYWIQPHDVMRLKCELIKHIPILIFGERQKLTTGGSCESMRFLQQQRISDSTTVSSVYLDDEGLQTYHTRLQREDYASVARVRWYGSRSMRGGQELFVERKVHREPWTRERSFKERAAVKQRDLVPFLAGVRLPEVQAGANTDQTRAFLQEVQDMIQETSQDPSMRSVCSRTAFQETSNNLVRVSVDTDLHMLKERGAPRAAGDWCRDYSAPMAGTSVVHFPYCVAEVKLQEETPPDWLLHMVDGGLLLHVPKFSKFLHGTATLFPDQLTTFPYWFIPDGRGSVSPANWEEMAQPALDEREGDDSAAFPAAREMPLGYALASKVNSLFKRKQDGTVRDGGGAAAAGLLPAHAQQAQHAQQAEDCQALLHAEPLSSGPSITALQKRRGVRRTRVEPKTFFANERTFLAWVQISVLIMFMALSLLSGSTVSSNLGPSGSTDSSSSGCGYAGMVVAPVAVLFMIYALWMYKMRTAQILRRTAARYDDQRGPVFLVLLLIGATLCAFIIAARGVFV
ncbi:hypothetical protein WJX72_003237 [[Myrmecia] bisecta]|uniref:Vacuolar transporter chaperone 4 n=1 Tax=[Myrmecia] bisecta TaxID=41462 RepID=A0AAW1PJK4_9CHLO